MVKGTHKGEQRPVRRWREAQKVEGTEVQVKKKATWPGRTRTVKAEVRGSGDGKVGREGRGRERRGGEGRGRAGGGSTREGGGIVR